MALTTPAKSIREIFSSSLFYLYKYIRHFLLFYISIPFLCGLYKSDLIFDLISINFMKKKVRIRREWTEKWNQMETERKVKVLFSISLSKWIINRFLLLEKLPRNPSIILFGFLTLVCVKWKDGIQYLIKRLLNELWKDFWDLLRNQRLFTKLCEDLR